jgi:hypothetical protein
MIFIFVYILVHRDFQSEIDITNLEKKKMTRNYKRLQDVIPTSACSTHESYSFERFFYSNSMCLLLVRTYKFIEG